MREQQDRAEEILATEAHDILEAYNHVYGTKRWPKDAPPPPTYEELLTALENIRKKVAPLLSVWEGKPTECSQETYELATAVYSTIVQGLNPGGYEPR